jgi:hypothetical protein
VSDLTQKQATQGSDERHSEGQIWRIGNKLFHYHIISKKP